MPPFILSCLTYLCVALPGSTLGMLWPSMRITLHEPVGALGVVLAIGVAAGAVSSALTGRILSRIPSGPLLVCGSALIAAALATEALAPALWLIAIGSAVFSVGFGVIDTALNAYAAGHFGARQINWMHAAYGLGAMFGPLLVTALLASGAGWRFAMGSMAAVLAASTLVLTAGRHRWTASADGLSTAADEAGWPASGEACTRTADEAGKRGGAGEAGGRGGAGEAGGRGGAGEAGRRGGAGEASGRPGNGSRTAQPVTLHRRRHGMLAAVVFTAVETGVESAAGIWGYIFLTSGRGLPATVAGVAVSAYWAMMFAGRILLGHVAERAGASRVLAVAVAGVPAGAALMAVPGPGFVAIAGMMALGLAAAPVFPLLTLTTADRVGAGGATRVVGLQVAASAVGSAALPSAIGLAIGAVGARALGPALLALGLTMCAVYWTAVSPASRRRDLSQARADPR